MTGKFNHHLFLHKRWWLNLLIISQRHFFNHHLLITMGPRLNNRTFCEGMAAELSSSGQRAKWAAASLPMEFWTGFGDFGSRWSMPWNSGLDFGWLLDLVNVWMIWVTFGWIWWLWAMEFWSGFCVLGHNQKKYLRNKRSAAMLTEKVPVQASDGVEVPSFRQAAWPPTIQTGAHCD